MPLLSDISEVKFERNSQKFRFKTYFDAQEYDEVDFLRPKVSMSSMPNQHEMARGIFQKRKGGILKVMDHVPPIKRKFFVDLNVNDNSEDLSEHV